MLLVAKEASSRDAARRRMTEALCDLAAPPVEIVKAILHAQKETETAVKEKKKEESGPSSSSTTTTVAVSLLASWSQAQVEEAKALKQQRNAKKTR